MHHEFGWLAVLLSLALVSPAAFAQPAETFELAVIKLADPLNPATSFHFDPGGGVTIEGAALKMLVQFAYDLRDFQLTGARGWMTSERYNIVAKGAPSGGPADYRRMNDAQRKAMTALVRKRMQALLSERFQLTMHRETRELPIFALVVAKNGLKMQPNTSPDGSPQGMGMGDALYRGTRASLAEIANGLASLTGRPVRDETGLKGYYDFKLEWAPERAPSDPGGEKPADTLGPSLFTALQEQLGLKLESKKGPVEILVIDRAEHPTEN